MHANIKWPLRHYKSGGGRHICHSNWNRNLGKMKWSAIGGPDCLACARREGEIPLFTSDDGCLPGSLEVNWGWCFPFLHRHTEKKLYAAHLYTVQGRNVDQSLDGINLPPPQYPLHTVGFRIQSLWSILQSYLYGRQQLEEIILQYIRSIIYI